MNPTYDWAVNKTKLNIAITRANDKVAMARAVSPTEKIPDATEEDVKNEYIKLAGLIYDIETAKKLDDQAHDVARTAPFVKKGADKFREKVEQVVAKAKKPSKKDE